MKKLIFIAFSLSLVIISCDTSGVKKEKAEPTEKADKKQTYERSDLNQQHAVADEKKMENGIMILMKKKYIYLIIKVVKMHQ